MGVPLGCSTVRRNIRTAEWSKFERISIATSSTSDSVIAEVITDVFHQFPVFYRYAAEDPATCSGEEVTVHRVYSSRA